MRYRSFARPKKNFDFRNFFLAKVRGEGLVERFRRQGTARRRSPTCDRAHGLVIAERCVGLQTTEENLATSRSV